MSREKIRRLRDRYTAAFNESPPRYGYPKAKDFVAAMEKALERGSPITLEEAYGPEVANGQAYA